MQLVAYGAQDFYLTGNPQITFFKVVYKRHTNFAIESIEQTFNGTASFGSKVVCNIQRSGDLINKMYLRTVLSGPTKTDASKWAWVRRIGHVLLYEIVLEIGGTQIDKHYNDWLNVWYELARNFAQDRGYDHMIGNTVEATSLASSHDNLTLWIPLQFACCRNEGLSLPVIALQYHDIKITITFSNLTSLVNRTNNFALSASEFVMNGASLYVDYVYLDNEERKKFAQAAHEYLFEQLQFSGQESISTGGSYKLRLNFNHPCKELIWFIKANKYTSGLPFLAYDAHSEEKTKILATKRFVLRCAKYSGGANPTLYQPTGAVLADAGLSGTLLSLFNQINPVAVSGEPDVDNIIILGRTLTSVEISQSTIELFAGFTPTTPAPVNSNGHPNSDIIVYLHDNFGINIDGTGNPIKQVLLQLNAHDRFTKREGDYFNYVQPWQCHTNTPADGINVYSFAITPEEHQPSGTCNMSRIDNATLTLDIQESYVGQQANISVYATNYNILRVMSGMGGLAYSN